ncbi:MAG: polysaccharide deacetylase family protein [Desulfatiglandaceae bacterium]
MKALLRHWYPCLGTLLFLTLLSCAAPHKEAGISVAQPAPASSRVFKEFAAVIVQPHDTLTSLAIKYLHDPSKGWFIAEFNHVGDVEPGQAIIIPFNPLHRGGVTLMGYQRVPVLCYHKFSLDKEDAMTVTRKAFETQLKFLHDHGYHVITLDQLHDFMDFKAQIPEKSVVITIDDGWRSTYDIAYPLLKRYGYPATLFVYTNLITGNSTTLSWGQIREMYANGIDMQCHTKTHRSLAWKEGQESFKHYFEAIQTELIESAKILKRELNKDVKYLAYPYGDTNHLVVEVARKLGYRAAFTVKRGVNPFFVDPYRIDRSMIYGSFSLKAFQKNLVVFTDFKKGIALR